MVKVNLKGTSIVGCPKGDKDLISLTDRRKAKDGDFFISDHPDLNCGGFAVITSQASTRRLKRKGA